MFGGFSYVKKLHSSKTFEMSWIYTQVEEVYGTIKKNYLPRHFL